MWIFSRCTLYPRKQTLTRPRGMSVSCHKQTHAPQQIREGWTGEISTAKSGRFSTNSLIRPSNFTVPTIPTLRPKLRKVPRKSLSMATAFDCGSLR